MNKVYVPFKFCELEPMEAIIEFYNDGSCIQEIVNAFIKSKVPGYNRERIKGLVRNYKSLLESGEYEFPTDIELNEQNADTSDGVYENATVYVNQIYAKKNVVDAIVALYGEGVSISNILKSLRQAEITSYTTTRIQKIIGIYKRLKKKGQVYKAIDIELEEVFVPATKVVEVGGIFKDFEVYRYENEDESSEEMAEDYTDHGLKTDEEIEAIVDDPLPIFRELNNNVMMVAMRLSAALLVTGAGGIGKSYAVQRVLSKFGKEKRDFVIMKGKCTPSAMYNFLFLNHDKICVFDDCDSVLCDREGLAVLKGALDSGKFRDISWNTRGNDMVDTFDCENRKQVMKKMEAWSKKHGGRMGIPTHFQFEGSVIFISNMSLAEIKAKDSALLTRCAVVDVAVTNDEVIERLGALLPKFKVFDARGKSITNKKILNETYDWISSEEFLDNPRMEGKSVDFRLFIKAYKARYARIPSWKEMAFAG